jgi:hypothetical protein
MARRRGGDKLFKREKEKRDFARKQADKELVKSIIIVCEDSVSSPTYFQMIIDKLIDEKKITPSSIVIVPHDGKTHPSGVLKNLKTYNENGADWKDFEHKWIVIDRDTEYKSGGHSAEDFNRALNEAKSKVKKYHIDVAYSNDSFELWYLLHFDYVNTSIMRDEIIKKVIKKLKEIEPYKFAELTKEYIKQQNYIKHIFDILLSFQNDAIKNAETLLESYGEEHNPEKDNPSTTVHRLVILLNNLKNV